MSPLTSREPGAVGAALEDQHSWCGLIVDGRHIDPVTMRLALRCKPLDRFMLVTDAMPSVGMAEKSFMLQGQPIRVEDGVCVNVDGTLAGSDLDMAARSATRSRCSASAPRRRCAWRAGIRPPSSASTASSAGSPRACAASLVALDDRLEVVGSWIDGSADAG